MGIFCYCSTVLLPLFGDVNLFFLFLYIILNHFLFGEFWFACCGGYCGSFVTIIQRN